MPTTRDPQQIADDLRYIAADDLRPAALAVAVLFTLLAIHAWVAYPPHARLAAVIYDLALVLAGTSLYLACRRVQLSTTSVYISAAGLSFAVLGNIVLTTVLGCNPLFSFHVALLLIASAGGVLSAGWAIGIALGQVSVWAVMSVILPPREGLVVHGLAIASGVAVAFIVHVSRHLLRRRIFELRRGDAEREQALQRALAEADEARRGLDRKVEERTAALRNELEERERLEEQLRHAQKMEAVGRLAGGVAHDFNNLLTVIRMSLLTVSEPGSSADDMQEAVRDASDATDRAATLTHDLLAFARKQALERTTVAVSDILGGLERMVRRIAEASVRLEVRISPDAGEIVADPHQIEQVLLNLAINACDAMAHRGTLSVTTEAIEIAAGDATGQRLRPGSYVRIAVTDTGTGMDEATKRSVFEPFFTTKEVGRGTGLGLAVAHGIVTQHGGQITVDSELGKGATFTVYLPRARAASPRSIVAVSRPLAALARETVLVVEDEAAVRRAVQRNLERLGYRVVLAVDGEDALRVAEAEAQSRGAIDLLLSDVVMPGIDGPELASRLRSRWSDLPVLFVTGYSADRLARSGAVGPRDRVLEKPYQLEELSRAIRRMLEARPARPGS